MCNALSHRKSSDSYEHVDLIPGNGIFSGGSESLTFTVRQNKSEQCDTFWSSEEDLAVPIVAEMFGGFFPPAQRRHMPKQAHT